MASPEYSSGGGEHQFKIKNAELVTTPEDRLEEIERLLEVNDANENIIERTLKREQLQEEQDAILSDIENSSQ